MPADLIITDANLWLGGRSRPGTMTIRDGRVSAVGIEAAADHRGPATQVLSLPGRLVLPGFIDAHIHAPVGGDSLRRVYLNDAAGVDEYLRIVGDYADAHPDETWITGSGWALEHFTDGTPTAAALDAVVPDRPVFLFNRDLHGAWVNSRALAIAGIDATTPDPADGRIERLPDGSPIGMLQEGAAYSFNSRHVPQPDRDSWQAAIRTAEDHLFSLGVTSWQDAWVTPATHDAYLAMDRAGTLRASVVGALWWSRNRGLDQIDEFLAQREAAPSGRYAATTVKIMTDGIVENRTAAMQEPYCGCQHDERGLTYVDRDLLAAAVTRLDAEGFSVHMHAIGDRAVRNALDAIQAARRSNGANDLRHHIAHLQIVNPDDVPRFAELGVVANCQPFWCQNEPQMDDLTLPVIGPERAGWQYPFAALRATGAALAGGSDWPVTTPDPLAEIDVMVNRWAPGHADAGAFMPEQRVPLAAAIDAFTRGSAFVNHTDDRLGALAPGMQADLAILDHDPTTDPAATMSDATVEYTFVEGQIVHS